MSSHSSLPPRVLMVIPGEEQGNGFIFAKREVQYITSMGIPTKVFYFSNKFTPVSFYRQVYALRALAQDWNADIVHAHFGTQTALLGLFGRAGRKLVITFRGTDLNWSPHLSFSRNLLGKAMSYVGMFFSHHNFLVSASLAPKVALVNPHFSICPTGVNTELFKPMEQKSARRELGWSENTRHIVFNSGGDSKNKRLDLALECTKSLQDRGVPVELHVMRGDVPADKVPMWMNAADVVLMLSDHEGSPTVVQEALACGTGVVAFSVGDCVERLEEVSNARVIARNMQTLVEAAKEVLELPRVNPPKVEKIDYRNVCQSVVDIYIKIASSKK